MALPASRSSSTDAICPSTPAAPQRRGDDSAARLAKLESALGHYRLPQMRQTATISMSATKPDGHGAAVSGERAFVIIFPGGEGNGTSRHGQIYLRADPRFPQIAQGRRVRDGQPGGDRLAGPHLRVPAQGSPGGGFRPRGQVPGRLGQRRGHRPAWSENRRRLVYTTDRSDSAAKSFTLDGKPTFALRTPGAQSDPA